MDLGYPIFRVQHYKMTRIYGSSWEQAEVAVSGAIPNWMLETFSFSEVRIGVPSSKLYNSSTLAVIGVGRLVSTKNGWSSGSMLIYQRVIRLEIYWWNDEWFDMFQFWLGLKEA